jgi:NAD-dependent dihydropyrimidine dehydrogenase PreA subunit
MGVDAALTNPPEHEGSTPRRPLLVISRDGTQASPVRRAFEDALLAALRSRGAGALVTPHLYYLRPGHPAVALLEEAAGGLVVGAWMYPRAALWTLRALGVEGPAVRCLDLASFAAPDEAAMALLAAAGGPSAAPPALSQADGQVQPRWYPVVDGSRCRNCRKCIDFCLFGVYSERDGAVVASSPDNCKDGCPACARTCPRGAIMFPHYFSDPAIAGAEPAAAPAESPRPAEGPGQDDLGHLVSLLEELDE